MITFSCSACQKQFSVKDDLAGKKAKCPGCGQIVAIPAGVVRTPAAEEMLTLPPSLGPEPVGQNQRTQASQVDPSNVLTHPPSNNPDATQGFNKPDAGHDSSLTHFLAPAQADDELGRLGKYRILKILGHGGMGVVFKAQDLRLKRMVAIKAMLPTLALSANAGERFLREAQAMAAVKHDHIATIHQVDEERGVPFLAMEFLAGEPLDERLKRPEKLPLPEVLRIGREIAEGLDAAHTAGLIHRDVKPANIWLEAPRGRVKILDFGLARAAAQDSGLTQQGAIIGTPSYMAPEQARGEAVDARCDLFSLGVVLYRLCTGQQPFKGTDTISTLMEVALTEPPPPTQLNTEVPPELSALVMRLLEKKPDRRPASTAEVVEVLQALERKPAPARASEGPTVALVPAAAAQVSENTVSVEPEPALTPKAKARRRRTPLLIAVGLLALVPLGWWLATVILRVETDKGTLVMEMNDEEVEARIRGGKLILTGPDDTVRYTLAPSERDRKIEAGPYKVRVEGADGLVLDTPEFTLKKGGKVTVRVTMEPKAVAKNLDPDRKAAEYVLSIGGTVTVQVNEKDRDIQVAADLPPEAFWLTVVNLGNNKRVSDAGLARFKDCKNLTGLRLESTQVGDAGLAHFKDCKNLTGLRLDSTQVSDAGLAHFKDCKNLTSLSLGAMQVSDAGLAHFKDCKNLAFLSLPGTQMSDAGLAYFKDCKNLTYLDLHNTQVSDAGLAHFRDCKNLTYLNLNSMQVGDAGLAYLKDCKKLTDLALQKTKVTAAKVEELKKALPKCQIGWDGM